MSEGCQFCNDAFLPSITSTETLSIEPSGAGARPIGQARRPNVPSGGAAHKLCGIALELAGGSGRVVRRPPWGPPAEERTERAPQLFRVSLPRGSKPDLSDCLAARPPHARPPEVCGEGSASRCTELLVAVCGEAPSEALEAPRGCAGRKPHVGALLAALSGDASALLSLVRVCSIVRAARCVAFPASARGESPMSLHVSAGRSCRYPHTAMPCRARLALLHSVSCASTWARRVVCVSPFWLKALGTTALASHQCSASVCSAPRRAMLPALLAPRLPLWFLACWNHLLRPSRTLCSCPDCVATCSARSRRNACRFKQGVLIRTYRYLSCSLVSRRQWTTRGTSFSTCIAAPPYQFVGICSRHSSLLSITDHLWLSSTIVHFH